MRRSRRQITAILGAAALALALTACSGGAADTPGGAETLAATADDGGGGEGAAAADDSGTVTVEITGGSHAGSYTRDGSLSCASLGDGRWINFAPGAGGDDEIASLSLYYLPGGIDADGIDTPFPGEHRHLSIKFGVPIASGDNGIDMVDGDAGSLELAAPSLEPSGRPVHHFIATTADGVSRTIAAAVAEFPSY